MALTFILWPFSFSGVQPYIPLLLSALLSLVSAIFSTHGGLPVSIGDVAARDKYEQSALGQAAVPGSLFPNPA